MSNLKSLLKSLYKVLNKPYSIFFIFTFLLNLISNSAYLFTADLEVVNAAIITLCLSALIAYIEAVIFKVVEKIKLFRVSYVCIVGFIHNLFIIFDYFCLVNFQTTINQDKIDIIAETDSAEIVSFLITYVSIYTVLLILLCLFAFNYLLFRISTLLYYRKQCLNALLGLALLGAVIYGITAFNYVVYHNGRNVPQYTAPTRVAYSVYLMKQREAEIENLSVLCKRVKAEATKEKTNIIVLIGESYSLYHSSLYGYKLETTPNMTVRYKNGELLFLRNAITISDFTHGAMESVFSLDSLRTQFTSKPLFPSCFKNAGYFTSMYDNQYFVKPQMNFLSNASVSEAMFNKRNTKRYKYDGDMIKDIQVENKPTLYVIHLQGQHYTYNARYPKSFEYFTPSQYDSKRFTDEQRLHLSEYDNVTRYNDYVVNELIKKFENTNTILIYFSDHGEELYEQSDYNGHGNSPFVKDLSYQIRVPFIVWMSKSYKAANMELFETVKKCENYPIITDDISHLLLDISGVRTKDFNPTRSFVNDKYNINKPRIVLNSINFDEVIKNNR